MGQKGEATMYEWEDYYKILQVHFMAETEVIESAYKRLSKKYHPDVNKSANAEEMMKLINKAYEVLGNPASKKQYFIRWMQKFSGLNSAYKGHNAANQTDFSIQLIESVLLEYMELISKQRFDLAFELISEKDKKNLSKKDFIKWQAVVSEVFELISYECFVDKIYSDIKIKNCFFETVVDFRVRVIEINHVMGRFEKDEFSKSVVFENSVWRIFLGYKDLSSVISKFDDLANLKKQKLENKKESRKQSNIDFASGLLDIKSFTEKAENEQTRHNRYGNIFSIILCKIDDCDKWSEIRYNTIRQVGEIIKSSLRSLDFSCRWKGKKFIILLPETNSASSKKVACKIQKKICQIINKQDECKELSISFIVAQQKSDSFNKLIRIADCYMEQINAKGGKPIVIANTAAEIYGIKGQ